MGKTAEGQDNGNPTNVFPGKLGTAAVPQIGEPEQGNLDAACDNDGPLPKGRTTPGFKEMKYGPAIGG